MSGLTNGLNREAWLTAVAAKTVPLFKGYPLTVRPYRLTCGWPVVMGASPRKRRVGECHCAKTSKGGVYELFISPTLDDPVEVAGVIVHELTHVAAGTEAGHGPWFRKIARSVGLTKNPPTSAAPGPKLEALLRSIVAEVGPYPHSAIEPRMKLVKKAEPTVSLECGECGCVVRITLRWLTEAGAPVCGCGGEMVLKARKGEDGEGD